MRRLLPLSLGGVIIISIPFIAFSLLRASPGPGAPARWSAARNISHSPEGIASPRIAVDNNGYLHLLWIDNRTGSGDLYYTKSIDGGTGWSAFDLISTALESSSGDMAVEPDGTVHVVWMERQSFQNYYVEHGEKSDGGSWLTSTVTIEPGFQLDPAIAVDGNYIYVIWQKRVEPGNPNIWYSYKPIADTNWAVPSPITDTVPSSFAPDVAVDSNGNVHVVWQEHVSEGAIWYSKGSWNETFNWSAPITVSQVLTGCTTPAIAVGSDNYVHVVWAQRISEDEQYVYYANFPSNDPSLIIPIKVFTEAIGVSTEAPTYLYPSMAIRGDSEVHVVWHGKSETEITDQIWYAVSEDKGNSWSSPIRISREAARQALAPDIALDEKIGHVVWQGKDESEKYQVMYSRGFPYAVYLPMTTKSYPGG